MLSLCKATANGALFRVSTRHVSNSVTFTAIGKPSASHPTQFNGKLRVPLLKSPSHFGHFTSRVNRLYNEDKYSANVLTIAAEAAPAPSKPAKAKSKAKPASASASASASESSEEPASEGESESEVPASEAAATAAPPTTASTVFNFNIFDGHGGEQCSTFLQNNLSQIIEESSALASPANEKDRSELVKKYWKNIGGYWKRWYKHRKDNFAKYLTHPAPLKLAQFPDFKDDLSIRLPLGFLEADYRFFESDDNKSGSTCTSVFIETLYSEPDTARDAQARLPVFSENYYFNRRSISKLTVAHVGDTKAILVDRTGEAHSLTQSHHPSNPNEASRLRKYAANFFMTDSFGEERFISLANTRAFGDLNFKQMGVTAEPELTTLVFGDAQMLQKKLTPEEIAAYTIGADGGTGGDEAMIVLVTDGVTNVLTDQEIADIVMVNVNNKGQTRATPQFCAEEVIKFVEYIGGDDNATCLVIRLNGWGKWPLLDRTGELRQERLNDYSPRGER